MCPLFSQLFSQFDNWSVSYSIYQSIAQTIVISPVCELASNETPIIVFSQLSTWSIGQPKS